MNECISSEVLLAVNRNDCATRTRRTINKPEPERER